MIGVGVDALIGRNTFNNNVILPGANAQVFGKGNVVTAGTKGIIVGDGQTLSESGMVVSNLTVTGTINGDVVVPYKKYVATISQTGTSDPTVTVLENTIGDIVWTRVGLGLYSGDLLGAFPNQDKVYLSINNTLTSVFITEFLWGTIDDVRINTYDLTATSIDGAMSFNTIEIRTY
jgi:hypothetical protein